MSSHESIVIWTKIEALDIGEKKGFLAVESIYFETWLKQQRGKERNFVCLEESGSRGLVKGSSIY